MVRDLNPHQDLPPACGGLKPIGGERERTDLPVACCPLSVPSPEGSSSNNASLEKTTDDIFDRRFGHAEI